MADLTAALVELSRALGTPESNLAILAEGNASVKTSANTFVIKASGRSLRTLDANGLVEIRSEPILNAFSKALTDLEVRQVLYESRISVDAPLPSVETFLHAYLLTLPNVMWVAHTHPSSLLSLLSIEGAAERAILRLFPDEVVCCGPATCYVPYADPGLTLANAVRNAAHDFMAERGEVPKTIWLQNHGLLVLGNSADEVLSGTLMSEKSARIWLGALASGQTVVPLTNANIERIHTRPDEHYRQSLLWQVQVSGL